MKLLIVIRVVTLLLATGAGVVSFFKHPTLDKDSISTLITIFTVMSGVLIAAITLVGSATSLLTKSDWKILLDYKKTFSAKLLRLTVISYLQIVTIVLLCLALFYKNKFRLEDVSIAFAVFTFTLSFSVPYTIANIYKEYYDFLINAGRKQEQQGSKKTPKP